MVGSKRRRLEALVEQVIWVAETLIHARPKVILGGRFIRQSTDLV
jgi:hypothetical protein